MVLYGLSEGVTGSARNFAPVISIKQHDSVPGWSAVSCPRPLGPPGLLRPFSSLRAGLLPPVPSLPAAPRRARIALLSSVFGSLSSCSDFPRSAF